MKRYFWKHFAAAIAALSATATLLTVLFDFEWLKDCWICGALGSVLVMVGSFAYAFWQTRSKKSIDLELHSELKLTISEGDLFKKTGVICIPVNEYFDTHVGDGVIAEVSIHGKFIQRFFKNNERIQELEGKIKNKLSGISFQVHQRRLPCCPQNKYELGTCIDINEGENTYVLFAFTHFDDNDTAFISREEYSVVVRKLMQHLSKMVEGRSVYMPLFGVGLSRMRRTPQRVLLHLVDALDFSDSYAILGGLNIVVESLRKANVNLTTLEYIIMHGISKDGQ